MSKKTSWFLLPFCLMLLCGCSPKTDTKTNEAASLPLSKEVFKDWTVAFTCYKKNNPKSSREEQQQEFIRLAEEKGIDTSDKTKLASDYIKSMGEYIKDAELMKQISAESQNCGAKPAVEEKATEAKTEEKSKE